MPRFIKTVVFSFFLLFMSFVAMANPTNDVIFKKASDSYDKTIKLYEKYTGKEKDGKNEKANQNDKITAEEYPELKKLITETNELFDQFIRVSSDADMKKAANYYSLVLKKMDIACLNDLGKYREAYGMIDDLEGELSVVKGYYYPVRYKNDGKNYIIEFKQRSSLEKQLLVEFTESSSFMGKYTDAAKYAQKAYGFYNYGDYNLWWTAHIWFYSESKLYNDGEEIVEASEKIIYAMSGLKRSDIKMIKDSNWANYTHAYYKLNSLLAQKPKLSRNGEVWAKAGENFEKLDEEKWAMEYYKKALKEGYGDKIFLLKMMEKGKSKKDKELVKTAVEIYDSKNLYSSWTCYDYREVADYFEYIDNKQKADELNKKYKECIKAQNKEQRRRDRGGKFFVSFAPLALLSQNIQASVQIGGNRRLHEFGIKQTNSQRDYGWDVANVKDRPKDFRWSGNSFYYTYKRFTKSGADRTVFYSGFQFRYTQRNYDEIIGSAKSNAGLSYYTVAFKPKETRYDFTLQFGTISTSRFMHIEYYMGAGLGYSVFDGGAKEWNNENYEIRSNNEIFANRKETRFGLTLRMGLMIGLNFVNKGY